jgi:hypothetical protein
MLVTKTHEYSKLSGEYTSLETLFQEFYLHHTFWLSYGVNNLFR